mmetsp:Transcript_44649/g.89651  ORF Transcript_44649/g.89651 Transcript_44649/m.89651 type:complete len:199 (+) Transcript_44649:28-624(+)
MIRGLLLAACALAVDAFQLSATSPALFNGARVVARSRLRAPAVSPLMALKEGPAPTFNLPASTDKTVSLNSMSGKWTVLYFYPKAFTQGCTCQAEDLQKEADQIRKLNAEILGVSVDPVDKLKEFSKAYSLSFPLLSDEGGEIASAYDSVIKIPFIGAVANRKTFIIDPKGQIAYAFDGVKPQGHGEAVIAKLKELQG